MEHPTSSTSQLINLAWPVLVAQLAMMANAVIERAREACQVSGYVVADHIEDILDMVRRIDRLSLD